MLKQFRSLIATTLILCGSCFCQSLWTQRAENLSTGYIHHFVPGDILLVTVNEASKSQNNFKSEISESTAATTNLLAKLQDILKLAKISPLNKIAERLTDTLSNQNQTSDMEGEGKMSSDTKLETLITVMVKKIFANGNLLIEGNKNVIVNGENQKLKLTGVIRPQDVEDNKIDSTLIAEASIFIDGKGAYDGIRKPGIFQKLLHVLF